MKLLPSFVGILFFCCLTVMFLFEMFGVDKQSSFNSQFNAIVTSTRLSHLISLGKSTTQRTYFEPLENWKQFILKSKLLLAPDVSEIEDFEDSEPQLVVVVCSALTNFERREAIRKTWGNWSLSRKYVYFIVGNNSTNSVDNKSDARRDNKENVMQLLKEESETNGDIIQYDFMDDYYNLTYKSLLMLRFFNEHILNLRSQVSFNEKSIDHFSNGTMQIKKPIFLLKTDDDMFIHIENLFRLIEKYVRFIRQIRLQRSDVKFNYFRLMLGCLIRKAIPIRSKRNKYFVPMALYPKKYYPNYLSGTAYLMSADVARTLFSTILFTDNCKYFFLEDIFITGICASKALVSNGDYSFQTDRKQAIKAINNFGFKFIRVNPKKNMCYYNKSDTLTGHRLTPNELHDIWKVLHSQNVTKVSCEKPKSKVSVISARKKAMHRTG